MDVGKKRSEKDTIAQKELLRERLKGILIGISLDKCSVDGKESMTECLDRIRSTDGNALFGDDPDLMELLKDIEWSKEESKNITELTLKKDPGKKKGPYK